ncbi:hypothetical protein [uncultured Pantoea sp.]|uniref:hypothetical protein n=1 Tax=uncultured Pantoea sp. TaxID=218084 RepID=UPI0025FFC713|nr:hypothetical protein [uncultured Pantoea sp.]
MSNLVLLGAGASYGSGDVYPYPPPLGNKLFERLEELGKSASRVPDAIKSKFKVNFEQGMLEYFEWAHRYTMDFQRELAAYLAQFSPGNKNNYQSLIRVFDNRQTVFCSLNYDLLFELSAQKLKFGTHYSNKPKPQHVRLLKIHGSSNFWPHLPSVQFKNVKSWGSSEAEFVAPIKPLTQQQTLSKAMTEDSMAPAIAMYAEGKKVRVSPGYIEEQQRMWRESLDHSSKLFIIGVKVHEADAHIWDLIAKSKSYIYYFGLKDDKPSFDAWKKRHNQFKSKFINANFSQAIEKIRLII